MAVIFPTKACNLKCAHCVRDKYTKGYLDLGLLSKFLKELNIITKRRVHTLTGGEPTIYPDMDGLFKVFRDNDVFFGMMTNAQSESGVLKVIENKDRVRRVFISIEGANENTNDMVRGQGSFNKIIKHAKMYTSSGVPLGLKTVLHSDNSNQIKKIFELADALGADKVNFSTLHPNSRSIEKGLHVDLKKIEEARIDRRIMLKRFSNIESSFTTRHFIPYTDAEWAEKKCKPMISPLNDIALLPNGKVSFCCDLVDLDFDENRYEGENIKLDPVIGDFNCESLNNIIKRKKKLMSILRKRRAIDAKSVLLFGPRQYICENCKFYFSK